MQMTEESHLEDRAAASASRPIQRILIAEDDEVLRAFNAMALAERGFMVDVVSDGAAALHALQTTHYDLLITDNNMPNLTGVELVMGLRSAGSPIPVILASGTLPTDCTWPAEQSPIAMLSKPYGTARLVEAVAVILSCELN